jgi:asparagine synthase (glutamine-hydrolysing)
MKVRGRIGKWVVRQWAKDLLPATIAGRKKWGFRVPLGQWFRGHLRGALREYLLDAGGLGGTFGDRQSIEALIAAHDAGTVDANLTLWTLLASEIWYRDVYLKIRSDTQNNNSHAHQLIPNAREAIP